jgi:hypothetical protein
MAAALGQSATCCGLDRAATEHMCLVLAEVTLNSARTCHTRTRQIQETSRNSRLDCNTTLCYGKALQEPFAECNSFATFSRPPGATCSAHAVGAAEPSPVSNRRRWPRGALATAALLPCLGKVGVCLLLQLLVGRMCNMGA